MDHRPSTPLTRLYHLCHAEQDELIEFLTAVQVGPRNPGVELLWNLALSPQSKQNVINVMQQYTLTHLKTYDDALSLLTKPEADCRPELDPLFVSGLLRQLGSMSSPDLWNAADPELFSRLRQKDLRCIVTIYNQLCGLTGKTAGKITQARASIMGGWERVCFLILNSGTTRQLLNFDLAQRASLLAEARRRDPEARFRSNVESARPAPRALAAFPASPDSSEINKPPGFTPLNVEEVVFLSEVQPELKYLPECTLCNRSLLKYGLLGRYPKCVHATAFHLACFSQHFLNDAMKRVVLKPVRCPVYGCGWSYRPSEMNLIDVTPESFRPPPDPESTLPDSQAPAVDVMVIE